MDGDSLYKQAMSDIKELVDYVLSKCNSFAEKHDYDKEWVKDRFKEEFNKAY